MDGLLSPRDFDTSSGRPHEAIDPLLVSKRRVVHVWLRVFLMRQVPRDYIEGWSQGG